MKVIRMIMLFWMAGLFFVPVGSWVQADSFDADIMRLQQINGSVATTNSIFPRIVAQLKQSDSGITESQWAAMKMDVFDTEVASLNEQLIPIFMKYFDWSQNKFV